VLAPDALKAAVEAQQSLNREEWPPGLAVRVRMGLHSGEGRRGASDYVGIDVHRAARVASLGHGGQILLSDATRSLVAGVLSDDWVVRDLGSYGLKGIVDPEKRSGGRGPTQPDSDRLASPGPVGIEPVGPGTTAALEALVRSSSS
jgi:class 3 adenylate cyclase